MRVKSFHIPDRLEIFAFYDGIQLIPIEAAQIWQELAPHYFPADCIGSSDLEESGSTLFSGRLFWRKLLQKGFKSAIRDNTLKCFETTLMDKDGKLPTASVLRKRFQMSMTQRDSSLLYKQKQPLICNTYMGDDQ